jgi:predicted RNA binding protein YcfA (HicA-like mRNA interferase family)
MTNGELLVVIPRHPRIKRETLRGIIHDAGLTPEEFRDLI